MYSEGDLLRYCYRGMTVGTKNMLNTSSGGDFGYKTISEAGPILKKLVGATREYDGPSLMILKRVENAQGRSEEMEERFEAKVDKLEDNMVHVNTARNWYPQGPRRDPYAPMYIARWRDHPNLKYGYPNTLNHAQNLPHNPPYPQLPPPAPNLTFNQGFQNQSQNQIQPYQAPPTQNQVQPYRPLHMRGHHQGNNYQNHHHQYPAQQNYQSHSQSKPTKSLEDMMSDLITSQQ